MTLKLGRDYRDTMPGLGESQQRVRVAAFEFDGRIESCHATGRIESTAESKAAVHQQQGDSGQAGNFHRAPLAERQRGMAGCQQLNGPERKAVEVPLIQLHGMQQILAQVNFATFEQPRYFAARSFADSDLHLWKTLRVAVQKL
jgi:hypothetical protein